MMDSLIAAVGFGVVLASIIAIGAMGFTVQFGLTNVLNLSYGAVMTIAAYAALFAQHAGVNPWLGLAFGGLVGAVVTLAIGRGLFKPFAKRGSRLLEMVMVTLGLSIVVEYAVNALAHDNISQFTVAPSAALKAGPIIISVTQAILIGIAFVVFVGLELLLRKTTLGKALRAMAVDPSLARSCGIRTGQIVGITWLLSGFLCGLAGVIYVINSQSVDYLTGQLFLPLVLAAAILGGAGSPRGAVLAALLLGIVTEVVSALGGSAYSTVAGFGILVIVLLSKPSVLNDVVQKTELTL